MSKNSKMSKVAKKPVNTRSRANSVLNSEVKSLSVNDKKILKILTKSSKPMSAYDILHKLRSTSIKAPPTVYRALESLLELGLVHRIHSLNAYISCHEKDSNHANHGAQFAVCRACGSVEEIHDHNLCNYIQEIGKKMKFVVESEALEISGLCIKCSA